MKQYIKRIATTAAVSAVCVGLTMQFGLPSAAYAVREEKDAPVMMTVNDQNIKRGEYADYLNYFKSALEQSAGMGSLVWAMYPEEAPKQVFDQTDEQLVFAHVILEQFNALGLKLDSKARWAFANDLRARNAAVDGRMGEWLEAMGLTQESFRNMVLLSHYANALDNYYYGVNGKKAPAESEIRETFNKYYKAKHILLFNTDEEGNPLPEAELQKTAADIYDQLAAGADFDALIKKYGEDPGMTEMPDGYIFPEEGMMTEEFVEGTKALKAGEYSSEPVETLYGLHIIKREELTDADYDDMRTSIVREMTGENIQDLLIQLMEDAKVSYADGHESLKLTDILSDMELPSQEDLEAMLGGAQ